jgi:ferredoxin--NADP+ reductase
VSVPESDQTPLRVAIVGAGPSGFYAAEALLKSGRDVRIDMLERLPAPFGLVRFGVAPDHPKLKEAIAVYDRIARSPGFRFYGNVTVGRDVPVDALLEAYHAVIFASGAESDRRLGVPGEDLPGSYTATEFVGWYNGHPDYRDRTFDLSQEVAVIVGQGNVAADVCRILAKTVDELRHTDIAEHALEALAASRIRTIHVLGRRGPAQAAFTNKELRELGEIPGVDVIVRPEDLELDPLTRAQLERVPDKACERNLETLREFAARPVGDAPKRIELHFLASPQEILGTERVEGLRVVANELYASEDGGLRARVCGEPATLPVGLVFRAIGYQGVPLAGVPFDPMAAVIPNAGGRIVDPTTAEPLPGEYVVGWIKRGPRGIIGTNKPDAQETARALLEDLAAGRLAKEEVPGRRVLERLLAERRQDLVSYEDWQLIDLLERERGEAGERPRLKFSRVEEMLAALAERKRAGAEAGEGGPA